MSNHRNATAGAVSGRGGQDRRSAARRGPVRAGSGRDAGTQGGDQRSGEQRGGGRSNQGRHRHMTVELPVDAARELLALLVDDEGDADEDLLDVAHDLLDRPRRVSGGVVVPLDERERRMVLRAIDDSELEFGSLIRSAASKLEAALTA